MSRLDEVEAAIYDEGTTPTGYWADVLALARTLAAEVDELTADRDSECRWACQYKDERDELQRRLEIQTEMTSAMRDEILYLKGATNG